jgi:hypothetical protein
MFSNSFRAVVVGFSLVTLSCVHSGAAADKNAENSPLVKVADIPLPGKRCALTIRASMKVRAVCTFPT